MAANGKKKYRFLLISAFQMPPDSRFAPPPDPGLPQEKRLMNHENVKHLLEDVEWEFHPGALASYGDWQVENREEFTFAAAARIPLGGGEPGFLASREITRQSGVVVTSCAFSQMHIASMLGRKFTVIDFAESHNMYYSNLVTQHGFEGRCASIRNLGYYHPRPGYDGETYLGEERKKALAGERSEAVERAIEEAEDALVQDGAEVITFGCSGTFWLQPFVQEGLDERGWEVPVLEGYSSAIELAKMMINLGVNASGVTFPVDRPKRRPRRVTF
jgi:Asp/Glu/hydantoin racemase